VLAKPFVEIEVVILLGPEHAGNRLANHAALVLTGGGRHERVEEGVRFVLTKSEYIFVGFTEGLGPDGIQRGAIEEAKTNDLLAVGRNVEGVMRGELRACLRRVNRGAIAGGHIVMESVFDVRARIGFVKQALGVGFVLGEKQFRLAFAKEEAFAYFRVMRGDGGVFRVAARGGERGLGRSLAPRPGIAEPKLRKDVERRCLRAAIPCRDLDEGVFR